MPRRKTSVKSQYRRTTRKHQVLMRSMGAIDIHFHGAFGIDLMIARDSELLRLEEQLWHKGVAGYCPTTLSCEPKALSESVARLGAWIRKQESAARRRNQPRRAVPLGIHLEGPFINSSCCGAHPPELIRRLDFQELENLWACSQGTLRIVTVAPETLPPAQLQQLAGWAGQRKIALSLGHSKATEDQAKNAFQAGFRGVTHAWNALNFHHRHPGPLGAALGDENVYVELIIDQQHVSPTLLEWTQKLHPAHRLCMISDCAPAAETSGNRKYPFGPLSIELKDGACRLADGALAGGGKVLTRSFCDWLSLKSVKTGPKVRNEAQKKMRERLKNSLPSITLAPLWALQISPKRLADLRVAWTLTTQDRLEVSPIDSN